MIPCRLLAVSSLFSACTAVMADPSTKLASFPNTGINAVKIDSSGNIFVAGFQGTLGAPATYDAFVAKLSPDGSTIQYTATLAGSNSDFAVALDIDSNGAAYILGQTQSPDFPVTPGAVQSAMLAPTAQGFVAKLDPQGNVVYMTLIGGSSDTYPGAGGLLVDAAGEVYASGQSVGGGFPSMPGAPFNDAGPNAAFLLKLDAAGANLLAAIRGMGGRIAADTSGNIYVGGTQLSPATLIPTTPGAFQSSFQLNPCGGTNQQPLGCSYQYVAKLDPGLTQILFATYMTGSWGASPSAISVDANGNTWLAGTTNSPDYPVTGQFQPFYLAAASSGPRTDPSGNIYPPPASGYITKVNPAGTALFYSTYFSGSLSDTITFAAFDSRGIYLAGQAGSPDLPGLDGVPLACMPLTFSSVLSANGLLLTATRAVLGAVLAYNPVNGALLSWMGASLFSSDPVAPRTPIACVLDTADMLPATSLAPGELLSIFGSNLGVAPIVGSPPYSSVLGGVTVTLNGLASPLLYVSPQQINLQIPYEIAGGSQVTLNVTSSTGISDLRTLGVSPSNPVAFLDTVTAPASVDLNHCPVSGMVYGGGPLPLAFNSDGSRNTCSHPASAGSPVHLFLAGLGVTSPPPITGSINPSASIPLNLPVAFSQSGISGTILDAVALPGALDGVWQVDLTLPASNIGAVPVSLSVNSVPVRDANLTIWVH